MSSRADHSSLQTTLTTFTSTIKASLKKHVICRYLYGNCSKTQKKLKGYLIFNLPPYFKTNNLDFRILLLKGTSPQLSKSIPGSEIEVSISSITQSLTNTHKE